METKTNTTKNSGDYPAPKAEALAQLRRSADANERSADAAERLVELVDQLAGALLNIQAPHGDGISGDRWSRRRSRGRVS